MNAIAQAAAVFTDGSKSSKHKIRYFNAPASTTDYAKFGECLATF